jgi:hypothetical protein
MKNAEIGEKNRAIEFFKCEFKFAFWLMMGLLMLNFLGFILKVLFEQSFIFSVVISILIFCLYLFVFIFFFIKVVLFNHEYKCLNIKRRVASWLSSLV